MENFDLEAFKPYIFIVAGLAAILYALLKKTKTADLKESGEKVQGIVYDADQASTYGRNLSGPMNVKNKLTIRFVTKKEEWITAAINQPFILYYTGQYKPGDKVDIYYDEQNPSHFYVDTKQSEKTVRLVLGVLGIIFCLVGLYLLYK
jgi:hypothetical protein